MFNSFICSISSLEDWFHHRYTCKGRLIAWSVVFSVYIYAKVPHQNLKKSQNPELVLQRFCPSLKCFFFPSRFPNTLFTGTSLTRYDRIKLCHPAHIVFVILPVEKIFDFINKRMKENCIWFFFFWSISKENCFVISVSLKFLLRLRKPTFIYFLARLGDFHNSFFF